MDPSLGVMDGLTTPYEPNLALHLAVCVDMKMIVEGKVKVKVKVEVKVKVKVKVNSKIKVKVVAMR